MVGYMVDWVGMISNLNTHLERIWEIPQLPQGMNLVPQQQLKGLQLQNLCLGSMKDYRCH